MEPCLGKNLYKLMTSGSIGEAEARGYLHQVCQAVGYLHNRSIIHRDIKPENVLIDCGTAKLCDFGWAVYSPLMRDTRCGTPLYTPPEMIRSESYDSKVDVWCIGIMAYELLYGTLPFEIRHPDDLPRIVTDTISFPPCPNVSEEAEEFMRGCLAKDSNQRITIKQALEHDFLQKKKLQFRHTFP
jgi:calcium/calmodulin-dependent protein kinase I